MARRRGRWRAGLPPHGSHQQRGGATGGTATGDRGRSPHLPACLALSPQQHCPTVMNEPLSSLELRSAQLLQWQDVYDSVPVHFILQALRVGNKPDGWIPSPAATTAPMLAYWTISSLILFTSIMDNYIV